jgi:hypothetical protein
MGHIYARPRVVSGISLLPSFPHPAQCTPSRYLLSVAYSQQCRKLRSIQALSNPCSLNSPGSILGSPPKICKMASNLCRVASKFCLNILHSSSSAPRQLPPRFSTSHTFDFGLRTDPAAAECLVFFAQFPETPCLRYVNSSTIDSLSTFFAFLSSAGSHPHSSVPNGALNGAILVHRWSVGTFRMPCCSALIETISFLSAKRSGAPPAEA